MLKAFSIFSVHAIAAAEQQADITSPEPKNDFDDEEIDTEEAIIDGEADIGDYTEFMDSIGPNVIVTGSNAASTGRMRNLFADHSYEDQTVGEAATGVED